jgi:hypothetical protein
MTITTGIAIYGAVLSTVGVGWNFYKEWKEKKKDTDAKLLGQRRELFERMRSIPFIDHELPLPNVVVADPTTPRYCQTETERMGRYVELAKGHLAPLMDLPEARQLYHFNFPVVSAGDPDMETALVNSRNNGFLPLQAIYRKLERDVTNS